MARDENLSASPSPEGEGGELNTSLLVVIWRQKWMILFLTVVGTGLGYLYFLRCPPVYQSSAQVLIVKRETGLPVQGTEQNETSYDTFSMHALLLRSPNLAAKAIEKYQLSSLPSLRGVANPIGLIVGGLGVDAKYSGSTTVLTLTFRGSNDQDCPKILDAIVKSYQVFLGETYQNSSEETAQLISQAKDVLLKQLTEKEAAYQAFRQTSPLLWKAGAGANLHEARMAEIEANRSRLLVLQTQTRSMIDSVNAAIKKGNREAVLALIANFAAARPAAGDGPGRTPGTAIPGSDPSSTPAEAGARSAARPEKLASLEDLVASLAIDEKLMLQEVGPDNPRVKAIRHKRELLQAQIAASPMKTKDGKPVDPIELYVESLREELAWQEEETQGLDGLFRQEHDAARGLTEYQVRDEGFRNDIARTQQLFTVVIKRLDEINLLKDAGGVKTNVVSAPDVGRQIEPKLPNTLGMAGILGALIAVGLAYLLEVLDKRFRAPDDIRNLLGLAVLGHIPVFDAKSRKKSASPALAALSPTLCAAHRPKGTHAEAYRAVRTAIYFNANAAEQKVYQVTSPNSGDGKTTTATNMAITMAESGKRVLLVDADFRRPRVHKLVGLENKIGLWQVIDGQAEIVEATSPTTIPNLWVMTSGGRPSNPAELLTSARFKDFLDVVREEYDIVVLDTPPVLAVTDACAAAPRVDAVVMVIRLSKNARETARHATETLQSLGAKILGVVVNGLPTGKRYGYGLYAAYGYRYAYDYGYKYGVYHSHYGDKAGKGAKAGPGKARDPQANGSANGVAVLQSGHADHGSNGNGKPPAAPDRL